MSELGRTSTGPLTVDRRRRLLARVRDRVAASDPAFSRLRLASRAILSMMITGVVLAAVTAELAPLPFAGYGIAMILTFLGTLAVRDRSPVAQAKSRAAAGVTAVGVVIGAGALSPTPVAELVFLAVIFAAVYIRRFGPRWFMVGMVAFMAYFIGDYLHPTLADGGGVALAATVALVVTQIVCTVALPGDPERDFRRATVTIDRRMNLILRELRDAARDDAPTDARRRELQRHLARLRDIVLMAEGFIPQGRGGALAGSGPASDLALAVFDLQLAVERLVAASFRALPPVSLVRAVLYADEPAIRRAVSALRDAPEDNETAVQQVLVRAHRARERLAATLEQRPHPAFTTPLPEEADSTGGSTDAPPAGGLVPASLHVPIQVTVASGLAIYGGLLLSSSRWYWAAIAAFIVFNNTQSRADTAMRAFSRSAGTFGGIIAGTVVATLVHGNVAASIGGILVLFFLAFYFLQTSYGLMIFFITIAIALLYGLMGMFSPHLLVVRLEETVIGAASGVFAAFLIFPRRARTQVASALDAYLNALDELVGVARERAHGRQREADLLALSRTLDRRYADLAGAARPLSGPWTVVRRFGEVREKLLLLAGCTHWARALARGVSRSDAADPENGARIDRLAGEVARQIERTRRTEQQFFLTPHARGHVELPEDPRRRLAVQEDEHPSVALAVISGLLARALAGAWLEEGDRNVEDG
ncbi:FUSC family protein [Arhodomonas sp. KWT2]|uniref:FUSC family protein n=2 Tax=unclassified Arhodomonas TaxID=2621637 RepID=UPI0035BF9342